MTETTRSTLIPTRRQAAEELHRLLANNKFVIVEGPPGCGKSSLIRHVAEERTSAEGGTNGFTMLQMGEQLDSKSLIGSYQCTEVPGEFVWKPCLLTQAVRTGQWLLLEDVGCARPDALGCLLALHQAGHIRLPNNTTVPIHPDFRLIMTLRTDAASSSSRSAVYTNKFWTRIRLPALTDAELTHVILSKYPSLSTVSRKLIHVFTELRQLQTAHVESSKRALNARDLLTWCARIAVSCALDEPVGVWQQAVDVLCSSYASPQLVEAMARCVAGLINVPGTQVEFELYKHKPTVQLDDHQVRIGRSLHRRDTSAGKSASSGHQQQSHCLTRSACVLLDALAVAVEHNEPVLLVGETGCGKTAAVQYLAACTGNTLRIINMSQQSETTDLLGGYKPITLTQLIEPIKTEFLALFSSTFNEKSNVKFIGHIQTCFAGGRWPDLLELMSHVCERAVQSVHQPPPRSVSVADDWPTVRQQWTALRQRFAKLASVLGSQTTNTECLPFAFVEGALLKAVERGEWLLLDEINLAPGETLNCVHALLEAAQDGHVVFPESDRPESLKVHPNFRLFACMNPATDAGKKNLTASIRNRFTERFVREVSDEAELRELCAHYLSGCAASAQQINSLVALYKQLKQMQLTSASAGQTPHYSLRTLCRALRIAASQAYGSSQRSIYEAACCAYLTQVDAASRTKVLQAVQTHVLGRDVHTQKQILSTPLAPPKDHDSVEYVKLAGYWLEAGPANERTASSSYVLTDTVRKNMRDVARALSAKHYPVLLQGETSVGKTSLIEHMAALTGNTCVRINNHEHTDIQEYVGAYAAGPDGKLVFVEGALVRAMRQGHWVILDELNLAPPEILESLNRLLDDNRELFIGETQTTVRPHRRFRLLATQNPAGSGFYGGRKRLSRAFRNRFVELHFDELPAAELELILQQRCQLPAQYARQMVNVMQKLQLYRSSSGMFAGKESYMTLRDLFRWGERYARARVQPQHYHDWNQYIADQGYLLLGGRCRRAEDERVVCELLSRHLKREVQPARLFGPDSAYLPSTDALDKLCVKGCSRVVWTTNMRRMLVLAGQALMYDEPVLLVGQTGCGKTTACQLLAALHSGHSQLPTISCHLMTEAADFLGRLRPASAEQSASTGALFVWSDGLLVQTMRQGQPVLLDEISLASDSVLERLNSVLEPSRTLLLTEYHGSSDGVDNELLRARDGFHLMATMNPGGDYGKKELSRALRNRFTEMWCSSEYVLDELVQIVQQQLTVLGPIDSVIVAERMVNFVAWFTETYAMKLRCVVTVRDMLAWAHFIAANVSREDEQWRALVHGACLVLLDGLGMNLVGASGESASQVRSACLKQLLARVPGSQRQQVEASLTPPLQLTDTPGCFGMEPFTVPTGSISSSGNEQRDYSLTVSPTCRLNAWRVLRALSIGKPVLLEGAPGVGKSSLIIALAAAARHPLTRLNLSDQTDLADLFGTDVPCADASGGQSFVWHDGPLLQAIKHSHWVLLDEMNLATQSVLEGLNACFDHRGQIYIPELGRTFDVSPGTRFFACQNPHAQGGNRRALPKSYINRFSTVYVEPLSDEDDLLILRSLVQRWPQPLADTALTQMVNFNRMLHERVNVRHEFGRSGAPWEFNLRDLMRWLQLTRSLTSNDPVSVVDMVYHCRFRTEHDRQQCDALVTECFGRPRPQPVWHNLHIDDERVCLGRTALARRTTIASHPAASTLLLTGQLPALELLCNNVEHNWLTLLVGASGSGKQRLVECVAALAGQRLRVMQMTADTDALELLGSFEQISVTDSALLAVKAEALDVVRQLETRVPVQHMQPIRLLLADSQTSSALLHALDQLQQFVAQGADELNVCRTIERLVERARQLPQTESSSLLFEWMNSAFVDAYEQGQWLLVKDVNACSAAVLDRLNTCLEQDGQLLLTERAFDGRPAVPIRPHPNFRLFFTMDPSTGGLSRAMRNRALEVAVAEGDWRRHSDDAAQVLTANTRCALPHALQLAAVAQDIPPYKLLECALACRSVSDETSGAEPQDGVVQRQLQRVCARALPDDLDVDGEPPFARLRVSDLTANTFWTHQFDACQHATTAPHLSMLLALLLSPTARWHSIRDYYKLHINPLPVTVDLKRSLKKFDRADQIWNGSLYERTAGDSSEQQLLGVLLCCRLWLAQCQHAAPDENSTLRTVHKLAHNELSSMSVNHATELVRLAELYELLVQCCSGVQHWRWPLNQPLSNDQLMQLHSGVYSVRAFLSVLAHTPVVQQHRTGHAFAQLQLAFNDLNLHWWRLLTKLHLSTGNGDRDAVVNGLSEAWACDEAAEVRYSRLCLALLPDQPRPCAHRQQHDKVMHLLELQQQSNVDTTTWLAAVNRCLAGEGADDLSIEPITEKNDEDNSDSSAASHSAIGTQVCALNRTAHWLVTSQPLASDHSSSSGQQLWLCLFGWQGANAPLLLRQLLLLNACALDTHFSQAALNDDSRLALANSQLYACPVLCCMAERLSTAAAAGSIGSVQQLGSQLRRARQWFWMCALPQLQHFGYMRDQVTDIIKQLLVALTAHSDEEPAMRQLADRCEQALASDAAATTGGSFTLGAYLLQHCCPPLNALDPIVKQRALRSLAALKLTLAEDTLSALDEYSRRMAGRPLNAAHCHDPMIRAALHMRDECRQQIRHIDDNLLDAYRPDQPTYTTVSAELRAFAGMTGEMLPERWFTLPPRHNYAECTTRLARAQAWLRSANSFLVALQPTALAYPDLCLPFVIGVSLVQQACHSLSLACHRRVRAHEQATQLGTGTLLADTQLLAAGTGSLKAHEWLMHWPDCPPVTQYRYVLCCIQSGAVDSSCLDWLLAVWAELVPAEQQDKEYEYKTRAQRLVQPKEQPGSTDNCSEAPTDLTETAEGDENDEDSIERRAWLPDYSQQVAVVPSELDDDDGETSHDMGTAGRDRKQQQRLDTKHLMALLHAMLAGGQPPSASDMYVLRLAAVGVAGCSADWSSEADSRLLPDHLLQLQHSQTALLLQADSTDSNSIDVYNQPPPLHHINRCLAQLTSLETAVEQLRSEWPEVDALRRIQRAIELYRSLPLSTPWMKMAAQLENLLEECDQWEQVAHKGNSVAGWLTPVKHTLLDWRRAQVNCWQRLLSRVDADVSEQTLCAVLPIITHVYHHDRQQHSSTVLAMCQQWLAAASLGDYQARLKGVQLVGCFVLALDSENGPSLVSRLHSLLAYYAQFSTAVAERARQLTEPVTNELADVIKVVKFQDLNTFSVKLSAQKAHAQLFRVIKKYKEALSEPCSGVYEQPLPPFVYTAPTAEQPTDSQSEVVSCRAGQLVAEMVAQQQPHSLLAAETLVDYADMLREVDQLLATDIIYKGTDEQQHKQHAAALAQRQRSLNQCWTTAKRCGWSYRKGLSLAANGSDALSTRLMLTQPADDEDKLMHHVTASRLLVHRALATLAAAANKPAAVGPSAMQQGEGLMEQMCVQLADLADAQRVHVLAALEAHNRVDTVALLLADDSAAANEPHSHGERQTLVHQLADTMHKTVDSLQQQLDVWSACPESSETEADDSRSWCPAELCDVLDRPAICAADTQTHSLQLERLRQVLDRVRSVCQQLDRHSNAPYISCTATTAVCELVSCTHEQTASDVDQLLLYSQLPEQPDRAHAFNTHLLDVRKCSGDCERAMQDYENRQQQHTDTDLLPALQHTHDALRLCVQRVHKHMQLQAPTLPEQDENTPLLPLIQYVQSLCASASAPSVAESLHALWTQLSSVGHSHLRSSPPVSAALRELLATGRAVQRLLTYQRDAQQQLRAGYVGVVDSAARLLHRLYTKGFVNAIPQVEEGESGGDRPTQFEDLQNAGLGDGSGLNDVTDEIEDQAQIEDLKNQNQQAEKDENPPPEPNKDDEGKQPIEMDDDFDAPLEDLNLDEQEHSDSESETGDGQQEPQPDMQMGDADEPHDTQLDPQLWDEENTPAELDDAAEGAQQTSDELTARDADRDNAKQLPDEVGDEEQLANEDEEKLDEQQANKDEPDMQPVDEQLDLENIDLNDADQQQSDSEDDAKGEEAGDVVGEELDEEQQQPDDAEQPVEPEQPSAQPDTSAAPEAQVVEATADSGDQASSNTLDAVKESSKPADAAEEQAEEKDKEQTKDEQAANDNEDNPVTQQQQAMDSAQTRGSDKRTDPTASNDVEDPPNKKSRFSRPEAQNDRTLADKTNKEAVNRAAEPSSSASQQDEQQQQPISDEYVHEPDLSATASHMQVVDAATLQQALEQKQQMHVDGGEDDDDDAAVDAMDTDEAKTDESPSDDHRPAHEHSRQRQQVVDSAAKDETSAVDALDEAQPQPGGRDDKSTIHTNTDFYVHVTSQLPDCSELLPDNAQQDGQQQGLDAEQAQRVWAMCQQSTSALAGELTENLRLILEPTKASQLEGDYRTGKRLNMRKLIAYVASHLRKNKIWLRRTREAARDFHILIAVDDSQSMQDNKTKMLAYESLSLLESALRRLEVGQLGVCKFGAAVELLHAVGEPLSDDSCGRIIQQLDFQQTQTNINKLLDFTSSYFGSTGAASAAAGRVPSQLLLIVSDGRGLFSHGIDAAKRAAQRVQSAGVFVMFIIVDNAEQPDSILDIRIPEFPVGGGPPVLHPYMHYFPFPFYMILRRIDALPAVVGDALRQWFEMIATDR